MAEYGLGSEVSTRGDVYSYGILLLEMITGKRPTDSMFDGGLNLHNYASIAWPNHVLEIADPKLLNNNDEVTGNHNCTPTNRTNECLISMVKLGLACSMELPQERWDISKAISELQLIRGILLGDLMQHAWPYRRLKIKLFSLLMLVLNSLLTLTFSSLCFLLQAHKVLQWTEEIFGLLNKHAYGLLRSILRGSYITHLTYVYYM